MARVFFRFFFLATCLGYFSTSAYPNHESKNFPGAADEVGKLPLVDFPIPFRHYSGYLDTIEDIKLHYWFFESQNKPETDPVVLWLNGGPGCSSLFGAFTENGPLRANHNGTFTLNPYSWNRNASLLYLESPVLVGFSFFNQTGVEPPVNDDNRTVAQNFAALKSFFTVKFPHLTSNAFYITGESYAGRYIPQLSVEILKRKFPSNFMGVAIGNGYLDNDLIDQTRPLYWKTHGLANPLVNPYNILADCNDFFKNEGACSGVNFLSAWMNRADVQRAIHIYSPNGSLPLHWVFLNRMLPYEWGTGSMAKEVKALVDAPQRLKVVIYNGDLDTVCDFIADQRFVEQLGYVEDSPPHLKQCWTFVAENNRKILPVESASRNVSKSYCGWKVSGPGAPGGVTLVGGLGRTFYSGRLVFLTVRGAGHMVPFDKPAAAFTIFNEILLNN